MKFCVIVPFFLMCQIPASAIDSLKLQLQIQQLEVASDTQKVRLLKELSWDLRLSDNARAKEFAETGIALTKQLGDSINHYKLYSTLGVILFYQSKYDKGIDYLNVCLQYFQRVKDKEGTANSLLRLGTFLIKTGDYQNADSLLLASSIFYKELNDESKLFDAMKNRGGNFYYWKKYREAEKAFLEALEFCEKVGMSTKTRVGLLKNLGAIASEQENFLEALDYFLQVIAHDFDDDFFNAETFSLIGALYSRIEEPEKGLEYHQKALKIRRKIGPPDEVAICLNNIGICYKNMLNYGEALKYYEEGMEIMSTLNNLSGNNYWVLGLLTGNRGVVSLSLHKFEEAESYFKEYLKIKEETKDTFGISRAYHHLAETYRQSGQFQKGVDYGFKSLTLSEHANLPSIIHLSAKSIADSYASLGNYKQAYKYNNKYWKLKDSIYGEESVNKIRALEIKYETAKKENELKFEKEQVKILEQKGKIDRLNIGLLALGLAVLTLIIAFLIYLYRKSKSQLVRHKEQAKLKVENITQENMMLEQKNSEQQLQLNNYLKQLLAKSEHLQDLKNEINQNQKIEKAAVPNINDLLQPILKSEIGLKEFKYYFTMVYKDFFKNLSKSHPNLTSNDLNLCALIKLNLSNKEIAQILNISSPSVKTARQRLYLKMNLPDNDALRNFIFQL